MLARYMLSSCVRPFVTRRYCTKTTKTRITQTTLNSRFRMPKISAKFQRGHPNGGYKWNRGRFKSAICWIFRLIGLKWWF